MIFVNILYFVIAFPFIVFLMLKLMGISNKQSTLVIAPLYYYCFISLARFVLDMPYTFLFIIVYTGMIILLGIRRSIKQHSKIYFTMVFRYFLIFSARIFPITYVLLLIFGYVRS